MYLAGALDEYDLEGVLSYFLWNTMPVGRLRTLAATGKLRDPAVLRAEVSRHLKDPRSQRFIEDFLGQWLKLIAPGVIDRMAKKAVEGNLKYVDRS